LSLLHRIAQKPVIAALRKPEDIQIAIVSKVDHIFFMGGTITEALSSITLAKQAGKGVFIHVDLIRGLSKTDKETIEFISDYMKADGIVTPKTHMIREAKKAGLFAVLHLFVLDSLALEHGLKLIEDVNPDAIELMPGIVGKVISRFADQVDRIPIIASGLIQSKEEALGALDAGATALSVSEKSLWQMDFSDLTIDGCTKSG